MSAEKKEVKKAKTENNQVRKVSPRTFSAKQRETVMRKWYALRKKGINAQEAATKVGVSYMSLHKWERRFGKPKAEAPQGEVTNIASLKEHKEKKEKKAAESAPTDAPRSIVITSPTGFKVEVSDVETAKQFLS